MIRERVPVPTKATELGSRLLLMTRKKAQGFAWPWFLSLWNMTGYPWASGTATCVRWSPCDALVT